jgi:hypothetical protein
LVQPENNRLLISSHNLTLHINIVHDSAEIESYEKSQIIGNRTENINSDIYQSAMHELQLYGSQSQWHASPFHIDVAEPNPICPNLKPIRSNFLKKLNRSNST